MHGGGWTEGDRRNYAFVARAIAAEGIVVVVPSYRLWPTTDAFRDYGGDPRHVVIGGHSAGGHLAALVGFDTRYLRDSGETTNHFSGVALLSGTYDLRPTNFTDDALFGSTMQKRMQLSPILYLSETMPPVLAVCASDEAPISYRPRNQIAAALTEAHGHVQTFDAIGRTHISEIVDIANMPADPLRAALAAFIRDPR